MGRRRFSMMDPNFRVADYRGRYDQQVRELTSVRHVRVSYMPEGYVFATTLWHGLR